ncbi:hypothetical protein CVT25_008474 [Psilocybe cyanescens]|uniref:Uncharacterized protein n=1 Tax=Psilocybe cyanescens TaxID=93625 RepID=A0A409XDF6_PSICY|nr:hypothetical protein CVT25_008474 [Psilocybe cyanescens]
MPGEGISSKVKIDDLKTLLAADLSHPAVVLASVPPWAGKQLDKDKGNWLEWSCYVQGALVGNGLFCYCKANPPIPNPTTQPRAYAHWCKNDECMCGFIAAGCSNSKIKHLKPLENDAAKYWKLLEECHTQQGPMGQVYYMHNAMALSLEPGHITNYVEKISKVFDLLDKVWAMWKLDLDALKCIMVVNALHLCEQDQIALLDDIRHGTAGGIPFTAENIIRFAEEQQLILNNKKDDPTAIALASQTKSRNSDNTCSNC